MVKKPILTLFTCPKPFTNPHIAIIQRNALQSWKNLSDEVEIVLLGEEEGLAEVSKELGLVHLPEIKRNDQNTPLVSSLFEEARKLNQSPLLAYVNADIVLFPDFVDSAQKLLAQTDKFLMVGQRWDLEITQPLTFSEGWQSSLRNLAKEKGNLHKPMGSDYFAYPRPCFEKIPDFAIGRAGWDNWMIYEARQQGWATVDATADVLIVHQNHDYHHLPGGQAHYRLPESNENIRLGGGTRHIFHLRDANLQLKNGKISRKPFTWNRFWREVETFPMNHLHSEFLAKILYIIIHPQKSYALIREKLRVNRESKIKE